MTPRKSLSYDTGTPLLDVYHGDTLIGHLGQHGADSWYQYTEETVGRPDAGTFQLSVRLPVRAVVYDHAATLAFFDNLLLESNTRAALARGTQHDQHDVPGLLGQVAGECAGAVSLWEHGRERPREPRYRTYTRKELAGLFDEAHGDQMTQAQLESRQSMSGVQDKLVFRKTLGAYHLPLSGAPGDVILKRPSMRYPGLVENEYVCQQLVKALGLNAAETQALIGDLYLLESRRYDRWEDATGSLRRVHQEDFCQATGRLPIHKYQRNRGPGFTDLARIIRQETLSPVDDLGRLLRMAVVNICLGNMDAHGKNFSLLYTESGPVLAPFYDTVSTIAYPTLDVAWSMYIGGASRPHELTRQAIDRFARELGVTTTLVQEAITEVTTKIRDVWPSVLKAAITVTGHHEIYDRIDRVVQEQTGLIQSATIK